MAQITLRAPAKLNLFLHVLGRRPNGYHDIESLVVFADVADTLSITEDNELSLTVEGEFASEAGSGEGNLVLKAAQLLQQHTGSRFGAKLVLIKNIPVGAGLGGGSADAAAALNGLNQLWNLQLAPAELHAMATTLGADVAMCLDPKPALVRGIGEQIELLTQPLPNMAVLLVHPRIPLLTKNVYGAFEGPQPRANWQPNKEYWSQLQAMPNDLQLAAITVNPLVAELLSALEALQPQAKLVRMSGSGACCFALYTSQLQATEAAAQLRNGHPNWWIKAADIL